MSRLLIDMQCNNDAFRYFDDFDSDEVSRILRKLADQVDGGETGGVIHDVNGNRVGNWYLEIDEG